MSQNFFTNQSQHPAPAVPALTAPADPALAVAQGYSAGDATAYTHSPHPGTPHTEGYSSPPPDHDFNASPWYPPGYQPVIYVYNGHIYMDPGYRPELGRIATPDDVIASLSTPTEDQAGRQIPPAHPELASGGHSRKTRPDGTVEVTLFKIEGSKGATQKSAWPFSFAQVRFRLEPNYLRLASLGMLLVWFISVAESVFGTGIIDKLVVRVIRGMAAISIVAAAMSLLYTIFDTLFDVEWGSMEK